MTKDVLKLLTVLFIFYSPTLNYAQEQKTSTEDFQKIFKLYQTAITNKENDKAVLYAEQAYNEGQKLYGKSHQNTAALATNYAISYLSSILKLKRSDNKYKELVPLFEQALEVNKLAYGEDSLKLIEPLIMMGNIHNNYLTQSKRSIHYYNQALSIAKQTLESRPLYYADLSLRIGKGLLQAQMGIRKSKKYLQAAYDEYHQKLDNSDPRVSASAFWLAKYHYSLKKHDSAKKYFLEVIGLNETANQGMTKDDAENIKQNINNSEREEHTLVAYGFLVNILEKSGESEEATRYCQAIGKIQPWDSDRDVKPIFQTFPIWPKSALKAGKGGIFKVSFTVDKQGFAKDATLIESKGHRKLGDATLKSLKKWRFAPKFENGQPVEAQTTYTMEFRLH